MIKTRLVVSIIFFFAFLVIGIRALPNYGVNWDEPIHFGRGQAILHFFKTSEKDYKRFEKNPPIRQSFYQSGGYEYSYLEYGYIEQNFKRDALIVIGAGHPVLSDLLASVVNRIVFGWLGLLGDIESYHLYSVALSAVLVGSVVYFTAALYGPFAAVVAGISLLLYPLFLGESRFNIKDPPETVFYAFTAMAFFLGIIRNNWKWILASSFFAGFAFGTKLNILFLSLSLVIWLCIYWGIIVKKLSLKKFIQKYKKVIVVVILFPIVPLILYFASWPLLWEDTINRFLYNLSYYKKVGLGASADPRFILFGLNTYAPQWIFFTTPFPTLALSLIGILWTIRFGWKEKYKTSLFVLLWFAVPILRVMVPGTQIYGGVRQIMEYIPAMAILAGIGAAQIVKLLNGYIARNFKQFNNTTIKQFLHIGIILLFVPITLKLISLHPNESIYFNELIGGLKGAKEKNIPGWGNSLGSTYRQGVNWLNTHAEKKARVATVYELRSNIALSDLRWDIEYYNQLRTTLNKRGEYIIGVTHQGTGEDRFHREYLERILNPVYEVEVDGVAVLKVWKNDLAHTKPEYKKEEKKVVNFSVINGQTTLDIDLKQTVSLTRLHIRYNSNNCTIPSNGYIEVSVSGDIWRRKSGDFATGPRVVLSKEGVLRYLLAAERTRFIRAIIFDKNSCLLKHPVEIEVYRI